MNICIIARGWPSERDPQWGCFERDQALALKGLGHNIIVLSVDTRFRRYRRKYGITLKEESGIKAYNLYAGFVWGKALSYISPILASKIKQKLLLYLFKEVYKQEVNPDILYGHYLGCCAMALAAKIKYGVPAVGIEHWSKMGFNPIKKSYRLLAESIYPYLDKQLVVSQSLKDNIKRNIGIDTLVVHNMIGQKFADNLIETEVKQGLFKITSVGSLLHVKGYDILIEAMNMISKELPNWELIIIGEGPERASLQEAIEKYGLQNNIKLIGRKNKDEIIKRLNESTMYVSSSRSENFSVSIIEALSAGLPVVATDCGGIKECLNEKNGLLAPVENACELANAILSMNNNIKKYDRKYISDDCRSRFSPNVIARKLTSIFEDVIKNSKK